METKNRNLLHVDHEGFGHEGFFLNNKFKHPWAERERAYMNDICELIDFRVMFSHYLLLIPSSSFCTVQQGSQPLLK